MKKRNGFTIIELVVVMAIFLFMVGAAVGMFVSIVKTQRRILSDEQLFNQMSYAQEYMSKALRMAATAQNNSCLINAGDIFVLTYSTGTPGQYNGIKFINQNDNNACQEFYLENGVLKEEKNGMPAVPLTSENLKIESIKFAINQPGPGLQANECSSTQNCAAAKDSDGIQPRITIVFNVRNYQGVLLPIQVTVSRRNLNVLQ